MRAFNIPSYYRSQVVTAIKNSRRTSDKLKKDLRPSQLDLGKIEFKLARHFGFCFGVENAIEIAYQAVIDNPDKRIFLLSEMIHNPKVNADLQERGVKFLMSAKGEILTPFETLKSDDVVIIPAFGTTVEMFAKLESLGIDPYIYNTTCPFVERVWKRARQLGEKGYTVVIHGKHDHEETKATFSQACLTAPSIIIRNIEEANVLADYLSGNKSLASFEGNFKELTSRGFDPGKHLDRIGVVNQTTMLATETQEIADLLKMALSKRFGEENLGQHFADTRDTLCYATTENQNAVYGLLEEGGDIALIVGGYNSSNTSHLVEICEKSVPSFYIKDAEEIVDLDLIRHLNFHTGEVLETRGWYPKHLAKVRVLLTAGASCPDALVDEVISKLASFLGVDDLIPEALEPYQSALAVL